MLKLIQNIVSIIALILPRWLTHRDHAADDAAEKDIVEGKSEAVNRDFHNLLRCAIIALALPLLAGCTACASKTVVIDSDKVMIPIIYDAHSQSFKFAERTVEGGIYSWDLDIRSSHTVHGWYVPSAQMIAIRRKLNEKQKE